MYDKQVKKIKKDDFLLSLIKRYYIIIPLITILVYFQTIFFDFVKCDDYDLIKSNYGFIDELSDIPDTFTKGYMDSDYYRPLVNVSLILDAQIGGQNPGYYHFVNFLLHTLTSVLLFIFLRKLKFKEIACFFGALVFAVHPLLVNAVAWIPGRNDLLFGLFSLISIITLIKYIENKKIVFIIIHSISVLLAVLSKETGLLLPMLLALYFLLFTDFRKIKSQLLTFISIWFVIDIIWFILMSNAKFAKSFNETSISAFVHNITLPIETIAKFIFPINNLSVLATYNQYSLILGIIFTSLILIIIIFKKEKNTKLIIFGLLLFLILTIPGMLVRRLNAGQWNDYLECRTYLPSIGLLIIVFELISKRFWNEQKNIIAGIFISIIIVFSLNTFIESKKYDNPFDFYQSAVNDNPNRTQFQYQFSKAASEIKRYDLVEHALRKAVEVQPGYSKNYYNLGVFLYSVGKIESSLQYLDTAITKDSMLYNAYVSKINILFNSQRFKEGRQELKKACELFRKPELLSRLIIMDIDSSRFDDILAISKLFPSGLDNSKFADFLVDRAIDIYESGNKSAPEILFLAALEIDNINLYALQNLFQYYLMIKPDFVKAKDFATRIKAIGGHLNPEQVEYLNEKLK